MTQRQGPCSHFDSPDGPHGAFKISLPQAICGRQVLGQGLRWNGAGWQERRVVRSGCAWESVSRCMWRGARMECVFAVVVVCVGGCTRGHTEPPTHAPTHARAHARTRTLACSHTLCRARTARGTPAKLSATPLDTGPQRVGGGCHGVTLRSGLRRRHRIDGEGTRGASPTLRRPPRLYHPALMGHCPTGAPPPRREAAQWRRCDPASHPSWGRVAL